MKLLWPPKRRLRNYQRLLDDQPLHQGNQPLRQDDQLLRQGNQPLPGVNWLRSQQNRRPHWVKV
ncbi:hypothetical [Yersinia pestis KIM10+]|uniref:Uncharacterized protein n=1 Tax=Yersinia pestis TaxID=632 RepID=Q8CLP7_YERPE|nr:hypothetical [Yersinia pestis KIM10+]